jgi:hypothetical protein
MQSHDLPRASQGGEEGGERLLVGFGEVLAEAVALVFDLLVQVSYWR